MPGAPTAAQATAQSNDGPTLNDTIFHPSFWVPLFQQHAPTTRFITLPPTFLTSLQTATQSPEPHFQQPTTHIKLEWSDGTETTEILPATTPPTNSPALENDIQSAITRLAGAVSPKFQTVSPVDATWAAFHRSTKCTNISDVLTLLQSSERVLSALQVSEPAVLALRAWRQIDPRLEFRLFIRASQLIAISPRAQASFRYTHAYADTLVQTLTEWFDTTIARVYTYRSDFVVDVFMEDSSVWLMDFAPWCSNTDPLCFSWEELGRANWLSVNGRAQFRSVLEEGVRPAHGLVFGLPLELRGATAMSGLAEAAQRLVAADIASLGGRDDNEDGCV